MSIRTIKKGLSIAAILCSIYISSFSQQQIDINQLSDQQLQQYINQANLSGLSDMELEAKARERGLSDVQIQQLKSRIAKLNPGSGNNMYSNRYDTSRNDELRRNVKINNYIKEDTAQLKVFGSDLFSAQNLTFEPNLQIPTPKNYLIGTGDRINIDVFGYSDATYKLLVSPDGTIRIPNLGPIKIAGLSFDDAQQKIKSNLAKIYPQISSGKTSVDISLGQIRTIRVTLAGEVTKPGTYSLPSLATIANALYVSGGPNKIGSYRNIYLVRNGKIIIKFDLYDFLLNGDLTKNLMLQDDDIIKVNPYGIRATFDGAIKRKAIYELQPNETLQKLLKIAGGFNEYSYTEFTRVTRNTKSNKEAIVVPEKDYSSFIVQNGDVLSIDSISNRYSNRVIITGAVFHPGTYSLQNFKNLKDLIQVAGLKDEAFLKRGIIRRRDVDYIPSIVDFNVQSIIDGTSDVVLQREDSVHIFNLFSLRQKDSVIVNGEVNKPGGYYFAQGMKLQDAILLAGGFKESASGKRIEVSRRVRDSSEIEKFDYAVVSVINLNKNLEELKDSPQYVLTPFDVISVRKNPSYIEQDTIKVEGQVLYPGVYTIQKNHERLSDIVQRAGGLKSDAYPKGALLSRGRKELNTKAQDLQMESLIGFSDSIKNVNRDSLIEKRNVYTSSLGVKLDEAINNPGSKYDVFVENGDVLTIPKETQTIKTWGAVYVPKQIVFEQNTRFKNYINESGGFSPNAYRSRSFVIHANGSVARTHHFLFFRNYPKVEQGSEIFVPLKKQRAGANFTAVTAIASVLATFVTALYLIKSL